MTDIHNIAFYSAIQLIAQAAACLRIAHGRVFTGPRPRITWQSRSGLPYAADFVFNDSLVLFLEYMEKRMYISFDATTFL